jgi:hypothetical protein
MTLRSRFVRGAACAALGFLLVAPAGCSRPTATVSGTLRHQGKAVQIGVVLVVDDDGMPHSGRIQPDGTYTVTDILAGPVRFAVISRKPLSRPKGKSEQPEEKTKQQPSVNWFPLPKHVEAVGTSGLSTTLQPGPNTFDLDLQ